MARRKKYNRRQRGGSDMWINPKTIGPRTGCMVLMVVSSSVVGVLAGLVTYHVV